MNFLKIKTKAILLLIISLYWPMYSQSQNKSKTHPQFNSLFDCYSGLTYSYPYSASGVDLKNKFHIVNLVNFEKSSGTNYFLFFDRTRAQLFMFSRHETYLVVASLEDRHLAYVIKWDVNGVINQTSAEKVDETLGPKLSSFRIMDFLKSIDLLKPTIKNSVESQVNKHNFILNKSSIRKGELLGFLNDMGYSYKQSWLEEEIKKTNEILTILKSSCNDLHDPDIWELASHKKNIVQEYLEYLKNHYLQAAIPAEK